MNHNKKQNIAILTDTCLKILSNMYIKESKNYNEFINIIKKYYHNNDSLLLKEYDIFQTILKTKIKHQDQFYKFLDDIKSFYDVTFKNNQKLTETKVKLLREIKDKFNIDIINEKINDDLYKTYASVYKFLNYNKDSVEDIKEQYIIKEQLCNFALDNKETNNKVKDLNLDNLVIKYSLSNILKNIETSKSEVLKEYWKYSFGQISEDKYKEFLDNKTKEIVDKLEKIQGSTNYSKKIITETINYIKCPEKKTSFESITKQLAELETYLNEQK